MTDRNIGGLGAQVDLKPLLVGERQVDALVVQFDYLYPSGTFYGHVGVNLDVASVHPSGRLGTIGMMVDYVVSAIPTAAVRWSGAVFEMGTSSPLVYWRSNRFDSSGTAIVVWQNGRFEFAS